MIELFIKWLLSAAVLYLVAVVVPGIKIRSFPTAMLSSLILGLLNVTVWYFLFLLTLPLTILTLGLFVFFINVMVLKMAAALVPGFVIKGWGPAILGALALVLINIVF